SGVFLPRRGITNIGRTLLDHVRREVVEVDPLLVLHQPDLDLRDRVDLPERAPEFPEVVRVRGVEEEPAADADGHVRVQPRLKVFGRPLCVLDLDAGRGLDDDAGLLAITWLFDERDVPVRRVLARHAAVARLFVALLRLDRGDVAYGGDRGPLELRDGRE